jgi:hypothetical protein
MKEDHLITCPLEVTGLPGGLLKLARPNSGLQGRVHREVER